MKKLVIFCLLVCAVSCAHKQAAPYKEPTEAENDAFLRRGAAIYLAEHPTPTLAAAPVAMPVVSDCATRVHFAFDKAVLFADQKPLLDDTAKCIKTQKNVRFLITGFADERGTQEYNLALGFRRAHTVAKYLARQGVSKEQLSIMSVGKDKPLCAEHRELCWMMNRRAEVSLIH